MRYETAEAFRIALDLGDFFSFDVRRSPALDAVVGFQAVRYTVRADLAGRRFEQFPADIAFSESPPIQAETLLMANSLEFAEVATPRLPIVSLEQHVAEKLHAFTGSYGQGERESTRVKDLVDLVLIGEVAEFDAKCLSRALATTFEQRAGQPLPDAVPHPPRSWARPYMELAREVGIVADIGIGHSAVADLLDPVLGSDAEGRWDPKARCWAPT